MELALFGEGTSELDHETQQRRMEVYQYVVEMQTEDLNERLSHAETQADKDRAYKQFNEAISEPIALTAELDDRERYLRDFKQGLEIQDDLQAHGKRQEQEDQQTIKQSFREDKQEQREEVGQQQEPSRQEKIQQLEKQLIQAEQKLVEIQKQEEKQQQQYKHGYSY